MLWRKDIGATAISGITADHICVIRFTVDDAVVQLCQLLSLLVMSRL